MKNIFAVVALLCIAIPQLGIAHGDGASFETEVEGYFIDIGYDPEFVVAGERVRFDFNTYPTTASSTGEVFTDVWVSIEQDKNLIFSGAVDKPTFGATGFNIVLPNAGEYELKARFQNNGTKVSEAAFPLTVTAGAQVQTSNLIPNASVLSILLAALIALALGYGIGRWFARA
jgi:hypothetical protein